jgi:hypothetical protein
MQLTRYSFTTDAAIVREARAEFASRQCVVLPHFLNLDLARGFARQIALSPAAPMVHVLADGEEFSKDLTTASGTGVFHGLHLLLNNPQLFAVVEQIAGCGPIGCFTGRIYRIMPSAGHHLDWHDDRAEPGRLLGLSISLSDGSSDGGVFRLRRKSTREPLAEVRHQQAGNAHLFAISPEIEHCVTPVMAGQSRTAFAGWFRSSPDRQSLIRDYLCGAIKG